MPAAPQHTVAMAFVASAVQALQGPARLQVLQAAGIAPALLDNPRARVPAAAFAALWLAVAQALDDEFFGLDSRRMKVGSFALLCRAVAAPGPLDRAWRQTLRGMALFLDDIQARWVLDGERARVELDNRVGETWPGRRLFAEETFLVMAYGLLCWLTGRRVPLRGLALAHPRPAHADEYSRMFCRHLAFDAPTSALVFDASALQGPVRVSAASLAEFLRQAPQSVFLKRVPQRGLAEQVRRCWHLQPAPESLPAVARQLAMSPATLRRRLELEGRGWRQLKDEVRRDRAIHLLAGSQLPLAEVAARLGFGDASAFHRAFRKWTGSAPGAYRGAIHPMADNP